MEIGPFVNYSKWSGELGSIGSVFIACSLLCVHLSLQGHFSIIIRFRYSVEFQLLSSSSSMLYCWLECTGFARSDATATIYFIMQILCGFYSRPAFIKLSVIGKSFVNVLKGYEKSQFCKINKKLRCVDWFWSCVSSGGAPTPLAHWCSKFHT